MARNSAMGLNARRTNCRGKQRKSRPLQKTTQRRRTHSHVALRQIEKAREKERKLWCEGLAQAAEDQHQFGSPQAYPDKPAKWLEGYSKWFSHSSRIPA